LLQLTHPIIFYDGYCALCNGWVIFILNRKKAKNFKLASIGGETFKNLITNQVALPKQDSIIFITKMGIFSKTDAVIQILKQLGGLWLVVAGLIWIFPKFIRNPIYDLIAHNRYRWFGEYDNCPIPPAEFRSLFLP
jgi:predicted DCC family thiol-disulfide oxidoreductase YuxK